MISIIIPFRDQKTLLEQCVLSVLHKTTYSHFDIVLVDNNSKKQETKDFLNDVKNHPQISVIHYDKPFNFSAINNYAARYAKGQYLLFLNNDTKVIEPTWLDEMLACFVDKKVGVVGARLLYKNGTIQHCGVMLEEKRLVIHAFRTWYEEDVKIEHITQWSAVTGACMMTKKSLFTDIGGFDAYNLPIAYNDVDYCLKVKDCGYKVMCNSRARLYHYESASRKSDVIARFFNRKRYKQFILEQQYMREKWIRDVQKDTFYKKSYI